MSTTRQALIAQLGGAMQAYQRSTQTFDDEVGRQLGLNPTDLRCLDWLVDARRSARQLSEATGLSSAATTTLIDRLEHKGFVRRVPHDTDRRQVLVEMTDEGRERVGRFYGPMVAEGSAMLAGYTKDQLQVMLDHLRAITELTDRHREALRSG
jgi:DNA-binding MarR family transcriptional regulator